MSKCPYTFAARSRAAMTAYLLDRRGYAAGGRRCPFSWDVKAYRVDWTRPAGEYPWDPTGDDEWSARLNVDREGTIESAAFEDAQRHYVEDWTSYPGNDQGDWRFAFMGRSGGHLTLLKWRGHSLADMHADELESWLADLPRADLRAFYRGIVCADSDFTRDKARQNVEWAANYFRHEWETERKGERERLAVETAARLESDRPDMYGGAAYPNRNQTRPPCAGQSRSPTR
jgi:hypothetical protein